ncbi:MAG: excinuclease ABC subunit UvrA [bacterium]|nr:excinuclease ABC subunit UvrA [bacterium]
MKDAISIKGARVNNLKDITVEIPKNKLVVITGLSGSGKSSLAFDTIFAEGQRRYVESLSSYARQFLELQDKPDVDEIQGLSPTIAISQRGISENPRSTVGTITEIADFLRLLFSRIGHPKCLDCATELSRSSTEEIVRILKQYIAKEPLRIYAPIIRPDQVTSNRDLVTNDLIKRLARAGFSEVRLNGKLIPLKTLEETGLPTGPFTLDAPMGTFGPKELAEDPEHVRMQILTALDLGDGALRAELQGANNESRTNSRISNSEIRKFGDNSQLAPAQELFFSKELTCPKCGKTYPPFEPRNFSFNSPHGACGQCRGLGVKSVVLPELVIPNPRLSLAQGAIKPWTRIGASQSSRMELLSAVSSSCGFSLEAPIGNLSKKAREIILFGTGETSYEIKGVLVKFLGVIPELVTRYNETDSEYIRKEIEGYMRQEVCPDCLGTRLKPEALAVTIFGKTIAQVSRMSVEEATCFFEEITKLRDHEITNDQKSKTRNFANSQSNNSLTDNERTIASPILKEIITRLGNLLGAGIGYLTLDRSAPALSGGEGQRVRLAVQLSSPLSGVVYILDEPTVGLHERDTTMLLNLLQQLLAQGNTVIVVEHDPQIMKAADWIIDMGPGAGTEGGYVVAQGSLPTIIKHKGSLTGAYLSGKKSVMSLSKPRKITGKAIVIKGATAFNLKDVSVRIPLGVFTCVTGVSGSGKSTLVLDILAKALARKLYRATDLPLAHKEISGVSFIDKVISVDQTPIGRTPRSNPATYTGIFSIIRDLYTEIPESKLKGFDAGTFSFNVKGGRCETCAGEGYIKIPMQFMSETFIVCSECKGTRYRPEALEIHYHNKHIAEVLGMSASEAKEFFRDVPLLAEKLQVLEDVGLGYIKLGQPAPTLSGGEAQRVKLATELSRRATGKTLYILDEPTTGLHFEDIQHLLTVLHRLVDKGNSVLVIEHNLDVIKSADFVIDMGPEGGDKGGEVVATGTPRDICKVKRSYTGQYLRKIL